MTDYDHPAAPTVRPKTKGQIYEGIGFNFCKAATILLLTLPLQKFALPAVAATTAVFYLLAHWHGQNDTRCVLKRPLLVAAFWGAVSLIALAVLLRPWLLR